MRFVKNTLMVGLALSAMGLLSCGTPKPECTVGQTSTVGVGLSGITAYAVRYAVVNNSSNCPVMRGEIIGFQSYHPATAEDPQIRDFAKTSIALRTQNLGELTWITEDLDAAGAKVEPNAQGDFANADPDASDMCQVPTITPAEVNVNEVVDDTDPMMPVVVFPKTDLKYEWTNMQVYVTAAATGTQFTADVKITYNGCTADYKAVGMWPAVDCSVHDADGNVIGSDDSFCHPQPDPANPEPTLRRPVGSGINPDFGPVKCDTNFGLLPEILPDELPHCVLANDTIPALEPPAPISGGE